MSYFKRCRMGLAIVAMAAMLGAVSSPLAAQETGTIRGKVVEAGSARPLSGVQVVIPGTTVGALTSASGDYRITGAPAGSHTVHAEMVGFTAADQTVTVTAGQTTEIDFALQPAAISLDALVVTGTQGEVSKRTIGHSVTTINAAEVTQKATIQTVTELLTGRAPGVTIQAPGGTVGAAGSLRIRGIGTLTGNNQPVVYVDGVRVYTGADGNFSNVWNHGSTNPDGGQSGNALSMINPQDIESIQVLKGPSASTLYGADAAAGVIEITTKKGKTGQQQLQWNAKADYGRTDWTSTGSVRNYTACTAERQARHLRASDPSSPLAFPDCQGLAPGSVINYSGLVDNPHGLRAGISSNYALSVRGGGSGYSFYIAGDRSNENGVFENNYQNRTSGRANFAFYPNSQVDFSVSMGYDRSKTRFPSNDNGGEGLVISAAHWTPGYNYQAASHWTDEQYAQYKGFAWNPPDIANQFDNELTGNRTTLGSTLNYRPFDWFKNRITVGLDVNDREGYQYFAPHSAYDLLGALYTRRPQNNVYTLNYSGTIENNLTSSLTSNLSFGSQYSREDYKDTQASGIGFASDLNRMVNQAAVQHGSDAESSTATLGLFAQEMVGWKNRLFLTGAVRMDNSSVFGANINRIFYPKAAVSYIISDEPWFQLPAVNQLKLRAAFGEAGSAPGPFAAVRTYSAVNGTAGDGSSYAGVTLGSYGNYDLKPERGSEFEAGFDASLLNDRAGIEFTFYDKTMNDAIMSVPVIPSSGFTGSQYQNLGTINNRGIELSLTGTPMQSRALTWNTRLSLYTNHNKLVSFGYDRSPIRLGYYDHPQEDRPGYPIAGYWAKKYVRNADGSLKRTPSTKTNPDGSLMYPNGMLTVEDTASYIGPATPTRQIGFSNTLTFFSNLDLYFLFDYEGGDYQYDYKDLSSCSGARCEMVANAEATLDNPNSSDAAKADAQYTLDLYTDAAGVSFYNRKVNYIQKADFVKLRDVSLTYRIPQRFVGRLAANNLSVNVAAHDLWLWAPHYDGADPEVNFYGPDDFLKVDAWTAPGLRRITASVNVSF